MKRLALVVAFAAIMLTLNGCAVYVSPYEHLGFSYGYAPYGGYGYGYRFYGSRRFRPHFYGWGGRGYGWRGHRWH